VNERLGLWRPEEIKQTRTGPRTRLFQPMCDKKGGLRDEARILKTYLFLKSVFNGSWH
jgi:hypothetical protein